jgi:hypothetical protein
MARLDARGPLAQFYGMFKIVGADEKQYGPVSADQLRQWISQGRADGQTLAQAEGSADWKPLASLPEFAGLFGAAGPAPGPGAGTAPPTSAAPWPTAPPPDIPTYLPHAIIVTLCCCPPFGIPAIIYASQVGSKLARGDVDGARAASQKARTWFWIAVAAAALSSIVEFILIGIWFGKGSHPWRM